MPQRINDGLTRPQRYYRKHRATILANEKRYRYPVRQAKRLQDKIAVVNVLTNGQGTCQWCGQGDIDVLTIDHINDDGASHRRLHTGKGGSKFYSWIINEDYPSGFQVLCCNCNMKKEVERRRREAGHRSLCRLGSYDARILSHNKEEIYETA